MAWGIMIAWYLFLAGVSAGAYLTADYVKSKKPEAVIIYKTGYILSPIVLGIGLLLLVLDAEAGLHNPTRFIYLLKNITGSMMTEGTYFISFFFVIGLYQAWAAYKNRRTDTWISKIGVIFAFATAAYTGLLIGVVKAVPLWNNSILPVLFTISAVSTGIAATVLCSLLLNKNACQGLYFLKKLHFSLLGLELIVLFIMLYVTNAGNEVASQSVRTIVPGDWSALFWIGIVLIGLVLPMLVEGLELYNVAYGKKLQNLEVSASSVSTSQYLPLLLTELFVLIGGFLLRYLILVAALPIMPF